MRIFIGVIGIIFASIVQAAVYKCKQADGSTTYSNVSCPSDTVKREYKAEHRAPQAWELGQDNRNVQRRVYNAERQKAEKEMDRVMRKQRVVDEKQRKYLKEQEKSQQARESEAEVYFKEAQRTVENLPYGHAGDRAKRESMLDKARLLQQMGRDVLGKTESMKPFISYEQAFQKAMDDSGYRKYSRLSQSQKQSVNRKLMEYGYLPGEDGISSEQLMNDGMKQANQEMAEQKRLQDIKHEYKKQKLLRDMELELPSYEKAVLDCERNREARCW